MYKQILDIKSFFYYGMLAFLLLAGCGSGGNTDNTDSDTGLPGDISKSVEPFDITSKDIIRVSIAGSSVTWGSGGTLDNNSYPGYVIEKLRSQYATTYLPVDLQSNKPPQYVGTSEAYTYKRALYKYSGKGTTISGNIDGKTLFVVIAKERENRGAALIDVYIDEKLVKTFSTKNDALYFHKKSISINADGRTRSWDLGTAYTYNHQVAVNGNININGKINDLGYTGSWSDDLDWLIIRKVIGDSVHHVISFKNPPAEGDHIEVTFDAGETIKPIKSTSGNMQYNIGSEIESFYGDRTTRDLTRTLKFNEGVDFRQTDDRAVISVDMGTNTRHTFRLVIRDIDPVATGTEPELFLNYITNKMFFMQNASIGGFTAKDFLQETGTTNYKNINAYHPDIVIFESSTNDDWIVNEWLAWKNVYMTAQELRTSDISAINIETLQKSGSSYIVGITQIPIINKTKNSLTLDADGVYRDIRSGDLLIIGDFKGDNRRVTVRIVESWDANTKTVTFDTPLLDQDYIGNVCQIRRINQWVYNVESFIDKVRLANKNVLVGLITGGIPNLNARRLEGYREKAKEIAVNKNVMYIDTYQATFDYTYNRTPETQLYLDAQGSTVSTGAKSYDLYQSDGQQLEVMLARNFKVYVNGKELGLRDYYVEGGLIKTWPEDVAEPLYLENAKWVVRPSKIVFEEGSIPPIGSDIQIFYNDNNRYKWSQDDTHLGTNGFQIFSDTIIQTMFSSK